VKSVSRSRIVLHVQVSIAAFREASFIVELHPRYFPLLWLWRGWKQQPESLTLIANLDVPPGFNLDVRNHRWCSRPRNSQPETPRPEFAPSGPFVITARRDWQREITSMLTALLASRECDFISVRFSRKAPHFSVTAPLKAVSPGSRSSGEMMCVISELASCASAARP
jgi:hypothetical protein